MRISASNSWFAELATFGRTGRGAVRERIDQAATDGDAGFDTVTLGRGSALLAREPLLLPTTKNVRALSAALSADLTAAFREAGLPPQPPIDIRVDSRTGRIGVSADRPDASQIEDMLNSDENLAESIRTTLAIGSHALGIERSLAFQREYLSADDPRTVVARYGDPVRGAGIPRDLIAVRRDEGLHAKLT